MAGVGSVVRDVLPTPAGQCSAAALCPQATQLQQQQLLEALGEGRGSNLANSLVVGVAWRNLAVRRGRARFFAWTRTLLLV